MIPIQQRDATDCGAACLCSIAAHYGLKRPLAFYRARAGTNQRGTSALGLVETATQLGFLAKGVRGSFDQIASAPLPAIAHCLIDQRLLHYVVIGRIGERHVEIMDPLIGRVEHWPIARFKAAWTGVLILLTPDADFRPGDYTISPRRRLWQLLRPHWRLVALLLLGAALSTVLALSTSLYVEAIVDTVIPSGDRGLLQTLTVAMLGIVGLRALLGILQSLVSLQAAQRIDAALILGYYRHLLRLPQSFFDTMRVGEISARVADAVKIRHFLNQTLVSLTLNPLIVVGSLTVLFLYSTKLALLSLGLVPCTGLLWWFSQDRYRAYQRNLMEHSADFGAQFVESLHAQPTIRCFQLEAREERKTGALFTRLQRTTRRAGIASVIGNGAGTLLTQAFLVALLWLGARLALDAGFTAGQLMSCFTLALALSGPMTTLIGLNTSIQEALVATDRLFEIMDLEREHAGGTRIFAPESAGEIRVEGISFRHPGRLPTFHEVSFTIPPGQITLLVGESGCGKSTLLALLQRLYLPTRGQIFFDGVDAGDFSLASLRRQLAVVPQHPAFLSGTLLENLAPGDDHPQIDRIKDLCREIGMLEFIEQLPHGLLSPLGENGSGLSGGQRQRLALVRALYVDAPFLLLDEPTAALDAVSTRRVAEVLRRLRREGKTIVIAAHDSSLLALADQIVTLANGTAMTSRSAFDEIFLENRG